jgi:large subunit ribosomal protein L28
MARRCMLSGKGPMSGNNVSHAKNRTKRRFLPNLRTVKIQLEDGTSRKIKISAKELRTLKKNA